MGQEQSYIDNWIQTVSTDQIHGQITKHFLKGRDSYGPHISPTEISQLRKVFNSFSEPNKTWNEASFYAWFCRCCPSQIPQPQRIGETLFLIASKHAAYPFQTTSTATLDFNAMIRVAVLFSACKQNTDTLESWTDGIVYSLIHDPRTGRRQHLIEEAGRSAIDRRRLLFQSLAIPKDPTFKIPETPVSLELTGDYFSNYRSRNQDCDPRYIDLLDVLEGIQPVLDAEGSKLWAYQAEAVSRVELREAAVRMPKNLLPEEMHIPVTRLKDLLCLVAILRSLDHDGEGTTEEGLLAEFDVGKEDGYVEWETFDHVVGGSLENTFKNLNNLFNTLCLEFGVLEE